MTNKAGLTIIVMGVSGCGKSTVAERLAHRLGFHFADGDDFHPAENIALMSAGTPLTDANRLPWLRSINAYVTEHDKPNSNCVVACSALKRLYRDVLAESGPVLFVYLSGDFELINARSRAREGHFMNPALLQSQFDALEVPSSDEPVVVVSIDAVIDSVIDAAVKAVHSHALYRQAL